LKSDGIVFSDEKFLYTATENALFQDSAVTEEAEGKGAGFTSGTLRSGWGASL
jgi:hypothetical protein